MREWVSLADRQLLELADQIANSVCTHGAMRKGVEAKHHLRTTKVGQSALLSICTYKFEIGHLASYFDDIFRCFIILWDGAKMLLFCHRD